MLLCLTKPLLLLAPVLFLPVATGLLWFPDAPNNLGDLDGLVDADGTFYMRYNNGACDLGGAVDPRCAAGPGGHCDPGISNFASATSKDGVHWVDHGAMMYAFDENATCPKTGSGSGSVWRASDNKTWMINYSGETIRMMKAPKPNGPWTGIGSTARTGGWGPNAMPNTPADGKQWYAGGRWDTMNTWPAPVSDTSGNRVYGWITVMGGKLSRHTVIGFASSKDGISFSAQPPAKCVFAPHHSCKGGSFEQCGCAWGGAANPRWYCLNGFRGTWGVMDGRYGGQATFTSTTAGGPYTVAAKNPFILAYSTPKMCKSMAGAAAYFTRFILRYDAADPSAPEELLVMHQSYGSCAGGWHNVYLAPLKLAHIDSEGTMRLKYWKGNDAMLGARVPVSLIADSASTAAVTARKNISLPCNNANGTVIVGTATAGNGSVIFYGSSNDLESIEMGVESGLLCIWTRASCDAPRVIFEQIDRAMTFGENVHWRMLLRGSMAEVYVNDVLILPLPLRNTVTIGGLPKWAAGVRAQTIVVGLSGTWAQSTNIEVHTMSLPALFPMGTALKNDDTDRDNQLWPMPQHCELDGAVLSFKPETLKVSTDSNSAILSRAIDRFKSTLLPPAASTADRVPSLETAELLELSILVESSSESLIFGIDESYNLTVKAPTATLRAATVFGAMYGLETFSQLCAANGQEWNQPYGICWTGNRTVARGNIRDWPRFGWRGLLLETGSHFYPVALLERMIDAMAANKLNALHWSVWDVGSVPLNFSSVPLLSHAAYGMEASYSRQDVRGLQQYAKDRGVRLVPNYPQPAHLNSFCDVLGLCAGSKGRGGLLDPSNPSALPTFHKIFAESAKIFEDDFIHIYDDEAHYLYNEWNSSSRVRSFMANHSISSFPGMETWLESKMAQLVKGVGKKPIVWESHTNFLSGGKYNPCTNRHGATACDSPAWMRETFDPAYVVATAYIEPGSLWFLLDQGFQTLFATDRWYLDYSSGSQETTPWVLYAVEPLGTDNSSSQFFINSSAERRVLGGHTSMWAQNTDAHNLESRVWPAACAIAERLWSAKNVTIPDISRIPYTLKLRLSSQACRMQQRGIRSAPYLDGYCCTRPHATAAAK